MREVYLGLGANIGDPAAAIKQVIERLKQHPEIYDLRFSKLYRTSPVGESNQPDFVNAVCRFATSLPLASCMTWIQLIEREMGKVQVKKNGPRTIDIDILLYGDEKIDTPSLQVPHPRMFERLFVLVPMRDITSHVIIEKQSGSAVDLSQRIAELRQTSADTVTLLGEIIL